MSKSSGNHVWPGRTETGCSSSIIRIMKYSFATSLTTSYLQLKTFMSSRCLLTCIFRVRFFGRGSLTVTRLGLLSESLLSVDFSHRLKRRMLTILGEDSASTADERSMKRISLPEDSLEPLLTYSDDCEEETSEVLESRTFSSSS